MEGCSKAEGIDLLTCNNLKDCFTEEVLGKEVVVTAQTRTGT